MIDCGYRGDKIFKDQIEKRTDVNIASHIVADSAQRDDVNRLIIVSGDSDLVPAIQMSKYISSEKQVIVYVPYDPLKRILKGKNTKSEKVSSDIRNVSDKHKNLPINLIVKSQFDDELYDINGSKITKPSTW
ncbi:hypothetical protein ES708_10347 [subsurface metagenome]